LESFNVWGALIPPSDRLKLPSGKETFDIHGFFFILCFSFFLSRNGHAGHLIKIVARIFALAVHQKILLFINEILAVVLTQFQVGDKLDGVSRTGVLAESTKNAPGKIDPEEFRIPPVARVLRSLEIDAIDRAGHGAEIARHTALAAVRIAGQYDPSPPPCRKEIPFIRILDRGPPPEQMQKCNPDTVQDADKTPYLLGRHPDSETVESIFHILSLTTTAPLPAPED
jgi:hypothetical protein